MSGVVRKPKRAEELEPTWGIAQLFPYQGAWSESEYLALDSNHLIEYVNGRLEFPSMPTTPHQLIVVFVFGLLQAFVTGRDLGLVLVAPLRVKVRRRKYREPDIVFMHKDHFNRIGKQFWKGADLVVEVVSEGKEDRERDLVKKRRDYAEGGIPEYWIIDPQEQQITVLRLAGKQYAVHGEFARGSVATSRLLAGFTVDVNAALDQHVPTAAPAASKPRRRQRS
jgi:Uma2 family endonuclease